jgi:hypothetical protein
MVTLKLLVNIGSIVARFELKSFDEASLTLNTKHELKLVKKLIKKNF